jgi:hypothetical protein
MSRHMPRSQGPQTAMEMIVESSALYSIAAIVYIPFRMLYSEEVGSRAFNLAFVFASGFFYSMVVRVIDVLSLWNITPRHIYVSVL